MSNSSFAEYNKNWEDNMRKIILTGAVLAMLTSAAPMVHAQVDPGVQAKKDYDAEINDLKGKLGKVDSLDEKINNIQKDLQDKITKAKTELNADIKEKAETQRQSSFLVKGLAESNQKLLVGADGKSGLKNDVDGLKNDVEDNKNKITQADTKAESAKDESAAASRLALEVKQKIDAMANGQNDVKKDIAELGGRINVTGAMSAALAGLKPLQYDPMAPTQVMGSVSTYEGQQAYALGLAHFTSEDLMVHGGVSFTNSHKYMANVGVTYKFGHSAEKSMIPMRYQAGPISSIYVMQKENEMMREKMAQQEERIAQLEEMIMNMKK